MLHGVVEYTPELVVTTLHQVGPAIKQMAQYGHVQTRGDDDCRRGDMLQEILKAAAFRKADIGNMWNKRSDLLMVLAHEL